MEKTGSRNCICCDLYLDGIVVRVISYEFAKERVKHHRNNFSCACRIGALRVAGCRSISASSARADGLAASAEKLRKALQSLQRRKDTGVVSVSPKLQVTKPVFISYSHRDAKWLEKLRQFLRPLEERELISVWDDTEIRVGSEWLSEIHKALKFSARGCFLSHSKLSGLRHLLERKNCRH